MGNTKEWLLCRGGGIGGGIEGNGWKGGKSENDDLGIWDVTSSML